MRDRRADDVGRQSARRRAAAPVEPRPGPSRSRGPDGSGVYAKDDVGLAHGRLAIIDLATGDQPLFGEGGLALVANGEIYNNPELRASLTDVAFSTLSDCEPPLALYRRHGLTSPDISAACMPSPCMTGGAAPGAGARSFRHQALLLRRNAAGLPVRLGTASDPGQRSGRAAVADEGPGRIAATAVHHGTETIFRGIHRLAPGETVAVEQSRIVARRHLSALPAGGCDRRSEAEALATLDAVLNESS